MPNFPSRHHSGILWLFRLSAVGSKLILVDWPERPLSSSALNSWKFVKGRLKIEESSGLSEVMADC